MKIKQNNKIIPLRDSITNITTNNDSPLIINKTNETETEKTYSITFDKDYINNNIVTLSSGEGINIDEENKINIDSKYFILYKTINSDFIEWKEYDGLISADLKNDKKDYFSNTTIDIFETSSYLAYKSKEYVELCNANLQANPKKITLMKYNNRIFFPTYIKSNEVLCSSVTFYESTLSILYAICNKSDNISFYVSKPSFTKADTSKL